MDHLAIDQRDQELMNSLHVLGPLLLGTRKNTHERRGPPLEKAQTRRPGGDISRTAALSSGDGADAQDGGQPRDQPRTQLEQFVQTGLLRFVCPDGPTGSAATPSRPGPEMEGSPCSTERSSAIAHAEDASAGAPSEGDPPSCVHPQSEQARRAPMGHSGSEGHLESRWRMDVPTLGTGTEPADSGSQGVHAHGPHAEDTDDHDRAPRGQQPCHPLPQLEGSAKCGALVSPTVSPRCGALGVDEPYNPQHDLELDGHDGQEPQPADVQTGTHAGRPTPALSSEAEGTRQGQNQSQGGEVHLSADGRQQLRNGILKLALCNTGTMCFANSAILCYLWASMSRLTFQLGDWGVLAAHFREMLLHADGTLFHIDHTTWYRSIVADWEEQHSQADSAEFTLRLLAWVNTPIVSNAWTRRVWLGEKETVHDRGTQFMPIALQLDPTMISHDEIPLSALLRHWHHDMGMQAGLTANSDLLVLHLDRFVISPSGHLRKLDTAIRFCWEVLVPINNQDGTCDWHSFQLLAAFAHHGGVNSGHYQAILRTFPNLTDLAAPASWLFCDDNRTPERCWSFPDRFEEGVTCFWLGRSHRIELSELPEDSTMPAEDADEAAILALLRTRPDTVDRR